MTSRRILMIRAALLALLPFTAIAAEKPLRYDVDLTLDTDAQTLHVVIEITLAPRQASDEVAFLLGRAYTVEQVSAGRGAQVEITPVDKPFPGLQLVQVKFGSAQAAPRIHLLYAGQLNSTGEQPINIISPELVELNLDSMWLPFQADFQGRMTVDARVKGLPTDATFISQGSARREGDTVVVSRTVPDVDFAFVAAPGMQKVKGENFELYAADPGSQTAQLYREHGDKSVSFLEDLFGPLPGKPAKLVVVERDRSSGYARRGYIVVTDGSPASESGTAKFVAHELGHAWLSNANPTSEHRWLDESVAEYVALRYIEHELGKDQAEKMLANKRESAQKAGAVVGGPGTDRELYAKGVVLLADLEDEVGRDCLDAVLRRAVAARIATTEGFLEILRQEVGADVALEFEQALRN